MTGLAERIALLVPSLQSRRYPTLLLLQGNTAALSRREAEAISASSCLAFLDYREDILSGSESVVLLGAYDRGSLAKWLKTKARESGGLLVVNVDDLISTWSEPERKAFFNDFLHIECNVPSEPTRRAPIVMITWLARRFVSDGDAEGQGIVFDLDQHVESGG